MDGESFSYDEENKSWTKLEFWTLRLRERMSAA